MPDPLWHYEDSGLGVKYSDNQAEDMIREPGVMSAFDSWVDRFVAHVNVKGTVPPGKHRAFDQEQPSHRIADLKLKWRELRMRAGWPREGSSPQVQQELGLNRDATWTPGESAAEGPAGPPRDTPPG